MRSGSLWLGLVALGLLGVVVCSGGWSPFAVIGAPSSLWLDVKVGAWVLTSLLALCAGPALLVWAFVKGPPARRDGAAVGGTVVMVLAGLALTAAALLKIPLLAAVLAAWFLGA